MGKTLSSHQRMFQKLLESDRRARERVERARNKAEEILAEADEAADAIVNEARQQAEKEAERIVRQAREQSRNRESAGKSQAPADEGPADTDSLRDLAGSNMENAVACLVDWVTLAETTPRHNQNRSKESAPKKDSR